MFLMLDAELLAEEVKEDFGSCAVSGILLHDKFFSFGWQPAGQFMQPTVMKSG